MSEILNLSEVCRCCHSSGVFKSLLDPFTYEGNVEIYSDLIRDVLGIHIQKPPSATSHTICEQCIMQLRFCRSFKEQVLECERKVQELCKNDPLLFGAVKTEIADEAKEPKQACAVKDNSKENKKTTETSSNSCEFCHQRFDKKQYLREHEIARHYNEALSCKICELTFKSHVIRTMHMKKHNSSGKGLRCKHCDKYYGSEKVLIEHINSHYKDDIYQCEICPKKFPYKHTLNRHREWHKIKFTESHIRLHKCNICSMVFKSSSELRNHKVCDHKSWYKERSRLRRLGKTRKEGSFRCDKCFKSFSRSTCLKRHMSAVHLRLAFRCDLCDSTFSQKCTLRRHKNYVHGDKKKEKEKCDICNKLCTNLKEHKKVHTRLYNCDQCFKSFPANNSLNRHIKFVHRRERPFSCDHCDATFKRPDYYRRHLSKAHGIEAIKKKSRGRTDRIENISDGINEVISRLN